MDLLRVGTAQGGTGSIFITSGLIGRSLFAADRSYIIALARADCTA